MSDATGDGLDILNCISLYAIAVDGRRWDFFDEIFTDDVIAEYGSNRFTGLADFRVGAAAAWGAFDTSQHAMLNSSWTIEDDQAISLTYGSWLIVRQDVAGDPLWEGRGWYDDQWRRTPAGWRIVRRRCEVSWSRGNLRVIRPDLPDDGPAIINPLHAAIAEKRVGFDKVIGQARKP